MDTNVSQNFVVWERLNKSKKWCPYNAAISQYLEICSKRNLENVALGDVDSNLQIYSVNLKNMVQVSSKTGTKSKIRRNLYANVDGLVNNFVWEWNGNDKDNWQSYDIDVNDFIEGSFQKGEQKVALKKNFHGYNYEIDFTKMLQINLQTKRKRAIRRQQNVVSYPVEQCSADDRMMISEEVENGIIEYPELSQEVPGTSELVNQLDSYLCSVTGNISHRKENSFVPCSPTTKKIKRDKSQETTLNNADSAMNTNCNSNEQSIVTCAIVNGLPWHAAWPPHTPSSLIKPVPGIVPLPKLDKKKAKKMKGEKKNHVDIFDLYTEEVIISDFDNKNILSETCIICCEILSNKSSYNNEENIVKMKLCSHIFHKGCLEAMYNSGPKDDSLQCPTCKKIHGVKFGIQPPGEMIYHVLPYSLPGFPDCDTIRIIYDISSGTQGPEHPRPGKKYTARGFPRHCYLPDNEKGRKVLHLLVKAWKQRLIFTIGRSSTTGEENTVTWNEIHHKTEFGCNRKGHGFPDPNYFDNILAELEAHGVKDDEVYLWHQA